jgi:hypothetical protein
MKFEPRGLWKAPLTDEQVSQAIDYGTQWATKGEFPIQEAFLVEFNKDLQATVSVSTAFERIAVYACQQVARAEPIDSAFVEMINSNPIFQTHYTLDIVSPHKVLSVLRFWSLGSDANGNPTPFPDSYEKMALVQRAQIAKGRYRQVVAFPYREELDGGECFEIAVQKLLFLSGTMVRFWVFLNKYH